MIKRIIHISDIHIRTIQLHDLYKRQFEIFLQDIEDKISGFASSEIRFVITGDINHQKITISNEQLTLVSWFIEELSNRGTVVLIPGNHDFLENNVDRLDTITPIVNLLGRSNVIYYKDGGVFSDENVSWVVYSLYQHNVRPEFTESTKGNGFYVGLFHGPIQGMSTDLGFKFDDGYDKLNFVDLDLLLCGDIHLRQAFKLPGGGQAVMIGSMIQQNFGESIKHHGYGVFNMVTKEYTYHDLPNEQPFLHFRLNDIEDIENGTERLVNT
jgi:DNA repair exonuclease SbcCD nuclease subunit